jgi:hypothetical protein
VCLDILRGAAQLAQPYAFKLCKLLREEGREGELPWVEALSGCLAEVVAAARGSDDISQAQGQVSQSQDDAGLLATRPCLSLMLVAVRPSQKCT